MERVPLKIYPHGPPWEAATSSRWHWTFPIKHALDPLVAVGVYLCLLWWSDYTLTSADLAVLLVAVFVLLPATIPFRSFSRYVVLAVVRQWSLVALAIGVLWLAVERFDLALDLDGGTAVGWLALTPLAMLLLHFASSRFGTRLAKLYRPRRIAVVGLNAVSVRVGEAIAMRDAEGLQLVGYFDDRAAARLPSSPGPVVGRISDLSAYVQRHGIDSVYISLPMSTQPRVAALLQALADTTASIHFLPDIFVADPIQASVTTVAGMPVVSVCETPFDGPAGVIKRVFDLTLVIAALPVLIPLLLAIAALVRLTSPGPALFVQRRYGLDGKPIQVLKFRTMTTLEDGEHQYRQVTRSDSRVTRVGHFLRATSLDELPQVFNVLCGTMSLVGPRPHALAVNEQYRKLIPRYMIRHKVKPGITGLAQVNGCRGGDDLESMRRRTEYDLAYLRSWSLALDALIVLKTWKILIAGDKSAY